MYRLWLEKPLESGSELELTQQDTRRVRRVLRLAVGSRLKLFNGRGIEAEAEILEFAGRRARVRLLEVEPCSREPAIQVHLVQALPKMDLMELVIQKATELGASEIGILLAMRCVPRWIESRAKARLSRWRRIAVEAARQCGRTTVPPLSGPWEIPDFLQFISNQDGLKLILKEDGPATGFREVLQRHRAEEVWVVVGPEGGFEEAEAGALEEMGFLPVRLGPRILRTETAGLAALAVVQYELGDLACFALDAEGCTGL